MKGAKLVALASICSAIALICTVTAAYVRWFAVALAALAATAVAIPLLVNKRAFWYSVVSYAACTALGLLLGFANSLYVVPMVVFALPCAIVKAFCENKRADGKKFATALKWILYFVLCEAALALTALAVRVATPDIWQRFCESKVLLWLVPLIANVAVPAFNVLLSGGFFLAQRAVEKSHFLD